MSFVKRTNLPAVTSVAVLLGNIATPATAQTNAELMEMVRALTARVEDLEAQLAKGSQDSVTSAEAVSSKAQVSVRQSVATTEQASAAVSVAAAGQQDTGLEMTWGPSPTFKSEDGRFEMHVRGRLQADFGRVSDNIEAQDRFATEFRRARLGVEGVAWKDFKYKFEIEFADDENASIRSAIVQYMGAKPWTFTVGQFKERVSLDENTSGLHIAVMERAGFTDAFSFRNRLGLGIDFSEGDFFLQSGIYGGSDNSANEDSEGFATTARMFWEPELGNGGRGHIGGSVRYRDLGNGIDDTVVRYLQRPFAGVSSTRYVSTGTLPEIKSDLWYGFEAAGVFGPLWASAEYGMIEADVVSGMEGLYNGESSVSFDGGYVDIGWFLTGESRPLERGGWQRPKVSNPVFEGGWGAVALVGRVDYLNLNDSSALVYGGKQYSVIAGLSWHLNRHTRIMFNYARTEVSKGLSAVALHGDAVVDTVTGKASIDAVTGRFQVDW